MSDRRPWLGWYKTRRWRLKRQAQLNQEPLCQYCAAMGCVTVATVADHVVPHRGDERLFWEGELQSLCGTCHDSAKQLLETTGHLPGCDEDGWPIDPGHLWNRDDKRP